MHLKALILCLIVFLLNISSVIAATSAELDKMQDSTTRVIALINGRGSTGSGFIVGNGDHVVTNWHVVQLVEKGAQIGVVAGKNNVIPGQIIWKSENKDLAIIKLARNSGKRAVTFASNDKIRSGETVYIIGYPGMADTGVRSEELASVDPTVTKGIVSRPVQFQNNVNYYQTDAAVNPGNSGGPMFNDTGSIIGIVAMKPISRNGDTPEGIGWAIQCSELLPELSKLGISTGGVTQPPAVNGETGKIEKPKGSVTPDNTTPDISAPSTTKTLKQKLIRTSGYILAGLATLVIGWFALKSILKR